MIQAELRTGDDYQPETEALAAVTAYTTACTTAAANPSEDNSDHVDHSVQERWDKRFQFAIKCVLSCPVALGKWKVLATKLDMESVVSQLSEAQESGYPHERLQKMLELWYEQKATKTKALEQLKTALQEIRAKSALGKRFSDIVIFPG